ncbi:MAG TPA: hypothetical protein VMN56_00225 [Casimicrobiaceae bacterium]|nr:hypothetical protein [Casimicrobiaceae bacterium]
MSLPIRFIVALLLTCLVILIAVILGDYGPWYFSWLLGTGFMVLVAAAGAVLLDAQDEARRAAAGSRSR